MTARDSATLTRSVIDHAAGSSGASQPAWCPGAPLTIIRHGEQRGSVHEDSLTSAFVPELPEVETVVRELRPQLVNRRLSAIQVSQHRLRRQWNKAWERQLLGHRVKAVRRRGKWIILDLDQNLHLLIHLGMTGQLTVKPAGDPALAHTHLILSLEGGRKELRFRDIRRFGSATLFNTGEHMERFFQEAGLGPEPFNLDADYWLQRLATTRRCLKALLLDQRVVAGVGNIYADESLFQACLHPARHANQTSTVEATRLRRALVRVLDRAITRRGSSIRDYVGGSGRKGQYQNEFRVYQRAGQPCPRCHVPIERIRLAGRATHFCARCQPL
jgi:formamidopyrimidine-DNA glycosylase